MKLPRTEKSACAAKATEDGADVVRASLAGLIGLSRPAESLCLHITAARSAQSGGYLSRFKGRGMEFDEVRCYQPGDDIRSIDWRVTARSGKPHTKLFREERERPVFISVDYRASMFFATRGVFKSVMAAKLAALLAWSANHHGDRVGGQIFSEGYTEDFKPLGGRSAVLRFLHYLAAPSTGDIGSRRPAQETITRSMAHLCRLAHPGSLVFLISDFRKLDGAAETHLMRLSRHCEVVMLEIHDPLEAELPPPGRYRLGDGAGELLLDTGDAAQAQEYRQRFLLHQEQLRKLALKANMKFIGCCTTDDSVRVLRQGIGPFPGRA